MLDAGLLKSQFGLFELAGHGIDLPGLLKTAKVLKEAVDYLAERPQALHATLEGQQQVSSAAVSGTARRVSLGTVPDYAYDGDGVRITAVQDDTPAAQAGLRAEDIIVAVNDQPVHGLRDYAQVLRGLRLPSGSWNTICIRLR